MRVKAAVFEGNGVDSGYEAARALNVREVDLEGPGPGEVLIRIAAAGAGHSDLSVMNGTRPRTVPMILGHEASSVVQETGSGVDDVVPGDHVVCIFAPGCGHLPVLRRRTPRALRARRKASRRRALMM